MDFNNHNSPNNFDNHENDSFLDFYLEATGQNIPPKKTEGQPEKEITEQKNHENEPKPHPPNIEDIIPFDPVFNEELFQTTKPTAPKENATEPNLPIKQKENPLSPKKDAFDLIINIENNLNQLKQLLANNNNLKIQCNQTDLSEPPRDKNQETGEKIILGTFDGEKMVGSDGKPYSIPANYASKSKLVEGDELKLIIKHNGAFIYKQTSRADRVIITGSLAKRKEGGYELITKNNRYRLIKASITFYNGIPGDQISAFIPKNKPSSWAAVDNIIKQYTHGNTISQIPTN